LPTSAAASDRRGLRHVAERPADLSAPRRRAKHADRPTNARLNPRDRSDQGRLAAAARTEQTGDPAGVDGKLDIAHHQPTAALDAQPIDDDRLHADCDSVIFTDTTGVDR
jgi:hypothetical protein